MENNCQECALRLFNKKGYCISGCGNPLSGRMIVVPNVDYKAYKNVNLSFGSQVDIIKEYVDINDVYIVPLIRCNETISCDVNADIINRCLYYLGVDLIKYDITDVLLLGSAVVRFFGISIKEIINKLIISSRNRRYTGSYSPLIQFVNDDKFKEFVEHLQNWYISSKYNNFNNYEIMT